MARSRVELFEQIRRDRRAGGFSIRELADRHHVHRRTVRQALASALPPPRRAYPPRPRPAIGPYAAVIDGWLVADRDLPAKQRHTARRIWQRLVAEHGAGVAEVTVSRYVARRRAELGLDKAVPAARYTRASSTPAFQSVPSKVRPRASADALLQHHDRLRHQYRPQTALAAAHFPAPPGACSIAELRPFRPGRPGRPSGRPQTITCSPRGSHAGCMFLQWPPPGVDEGPPGAGGARSAAARGLTGISRPARARR
jgi:hypothetical protein